MWRSVYTALLVGTFVLALFGSASAEAKTHALLIGVGNYENVRDLEGPPHDVEAMHSVLQDRWGVVSEDIISLVDQQATKRNILSAIDQLGVRSRSGDFVFVYFSGHGTSAFDASMDTGKALRAWTGAILPYDYEEGETSQQTLDSLIVGSRDLRPRFETLDRDRRLFVVFDSCFSGQAVRSLPRHLPVKPVYRYVETFRSGDFDPGTDEELFGPGDEDPVTGQQPEYPYRRLIYIGAASRFEKARDIPADQLIDFPTFDGRPHGALSDALLRRLAEGNAGQDYEAVFEAVQRDVESRFDHKPRMLFPPERLDLLNLPLFQALDPRTPGEVDAPAPTPAASTTLRLRLDSTSLHLAEKLRDIPGLTLSRNAYDVLLRIDRGMASLFHPGGDLIVGGLRIDPLIDLRTHLLHQARIHWLLHMARPGDTFRTRLRLTGDHGFLTPDDAFTVEAATDRAAVHLLLDIDTEGKVSVLYPYVESEKRPRPGFELGNGEELRVRPPWGTGHLVLFAFATSPPGLDAWMRAEIEPGSPRLQRLMDWIENAPGERAADRTKLVVAPGVEMSSGS